MKIIKKLALCVLFVKVVHSAELPEDHPIKTAVQMAKFAFMQHSLPSDTESTSGVIHIIREQLPLIQSIVVKNSTEYVDKLFFMNHEKDVFLLSSQMTTVLLREYRPGLPNNINIGSTLDAIIVELDTYIHQSFENHFNLRMQKNEFVSAYKLAVVYHDANTENVTKASTWIEQICDKATTEITKLAKTVTALIGVPDLEANYRICAEEIIAIFPANDRIHIQLRSCFDDILAEPRPHVPDVARLTLQRDIADRLFS